MFVCVCGLFRGRGCACGACILVARDRQACANRVFVLIISGTTALICRRWRAETRNVGRHVELNRFDYIFVVLVLLNRYLFQNETANYPGCTNRMQLICEASQICFRWVIKVMIALVFYDRNDPSWVFSTSIDCQCKCARSHPIHKRSSCLSIKQIRKTCSALGFYYSERRALMLSAPRPSIALTLNGARLESAAAHTRCEYNSMHTRTRLVAVQSHSPNTNNCLLLLCVCSRRRGGHGHSSVFGGIL